jgi:hypothetical protein
MTEAGERRATKTTTLLTTQFMKLHLDPEEPEDTVFIAFSFPSLKVIALGDLNNLPFPIPVLGLIKMQSTRYARRTKLTICQKQYLFG